MAWLFGKGSRRMDDGPSSTKSPTTDVGEASQAIASIFAPKHAALSSSDSPAHAPPQEPTASSWSAASRDSGGDRVTGWTATKADNSRHGRQPPGSADSHEGVKTGSASSFVASIESLPPCPIAGYTLDREKGIVDTLAKPPRALSVQELRSVLIQLSGLEQSAKHTVDTSFASQMGGRSLRALELLVSPCLFLVGTYLMTYKTAQLYAAALPRQSFLLNHFSSILQSVTAVSSRKAGSARTASVAGSMTTGDKEKLAQRHRGIMQATNTRVALTFLSGVFVFTVALVTRPGLDVVENNPEAALGREMVGYQQHSEASLKWLWFVYYHHPAYSKDATSLLAPPVAR